MAGAYIEHVVHGTSSILSALRDLPPIVTAAKSPRVCRIGRASAKVYSHSSKDDAPAFIRSSLRCLTVIVTCVSPSHWLGLATEVDGLRGQNHGIEKINAVILSSFMRLALRRHAAFQHQC